MAKAEKGDLIRIVSKHPEVTAYEIGGIYEVIGEYADDNQVLINGIDGVRGYVEHHEYVIHRKSGEEDAPTCKHCGKTGVHTCRGPKEDAVNHPNHYTQGRFETIEIIEEITQGYEDGYVAYCVGNALKYLARAPFKHGEPTEDLRKAAKYLEFAIGRLTQNERNTIE